MIVSPSTHSNASSGRNWLWVMLASSALAILLLAINLRVHESPWGVEADGYFLIDTPSESFALLQQPVLFPAMLKALFAMGIEPFRAGQILSAICFAAFLLLVYLFSAHLQNDEFLALATTAATPLFPGVLTAALLGSSDMLFAVIAMAALLFWLRCKQPIHPRHAAIFGTLAALSFLTKFSGLFLFISALAIIARPFRPRTSAWRAIAMACIAFFASILLIGFVSQAFGLDNADSAMGRRFLDFKSFIQMLFVFTLVPPIPIDPNRLLGSLAPYWATILFRLAMTPIEWLVELVRVFLPATVASAVYLAFIDKTNHRPWRVLTIWAFFYMLLVSYASYPFDDISRYFLFFAPVFLGAFFATAKILFNSLSPRLRGAFGLWIAVAVIAILINLGFNSYRHVRQLALYEDYATQGDRPHLSAQAAYEAIAEKNRRFGSESSYATNNSIFGRFDRNILFYSWFFEGGPHPVLDVAERSSDYHAAGLLRFMCNKKTEILVYDGTDRLLQIRWTDFGKTDSDSRLAPHYLMPVSRNGNIALFKLKPDACLTGDAPPPAGPPTENL